MAEDFTDERTPDALLVLSTRLGDRAAGDRLVRRWQPRLTAHARRLLGEAEPARDVVQAAWMEILRGLDGLRDPAAFPAWAYRIVTRRCAAMIGGRRRDRALAAGMAREARVPPEPPPGPDAADDHGRLRAAVRTLPPDQRAAIALFHFEGLSVAETAVALDAPVGTVKTRLMHARRKLRAALEGDRHD
jgi:RNA polymerase sigma factor (sigma-70 family)